MQQIIKFRFFALVFATVLAACGGGGSDNDNPSGGGSPSQTYWVFDGNANQHVVLDGVSTQFAVRKSDDVLVHLASGKGLTGLQFSSDGGAILRNGQKIGAIILVSGQDGKSIAALTCTGPAPNFGAMTIAVTGDSWTHSCASNTGVPTYVPWTGNSNGTVVKDASNHNFAVNAATNVVHDYETHYALNGLTAPNGGSVYLDGGQIGSIVLVNGENNSRVAVFRCTNGNRMQITLTRTSWSYACGSGSGGSPSDGSGGTFGPITDPGGDGGGNGNNPPPTSPVVSWNLVSQGALAGNPYSRYQVTVRNTGNVRVSCQVNIAYEAIDFDGVIRATNQTLSAGPIAVGATAQMVLSLGDRNFTFIRINNLSCNRWPFD